MSRTCLLLHADTHKIPFTKMKLLSMSTPPQDINLRGVLSETRRIIKANRNHFSIIALLLLPYSVLLMYPIIFPTGAQSNSTLLRFIYLIVSFIFSLCASGTITYSTFHGYYNRPLDLISTFKSLSSSFIPLLSTMFVLQLIIYSIAFLIAIIFIFIYKWLESNGTNIGYEFDYVTLIVILAVLMASVCLIYLQLNWVLASVVSVVEWKWWYEPIRRSAYLIKGAKMVAFKMIMLFGVLSYVLVWSYYWNSWKSDTDRVWLWVFQMAVGSSVMTMLMKYSLAAVVVLYIYCKEKHDELAMEIQPYEYVSLAIDDDGNKYDAAVVHV